MPRIKLERAKRGQARAAAHAPQADEAAAKRSRTELIMSEAKSAGLLGGPKDTVIRGRVPKALVKAAKKRAGVATDTELLEVALSSLALADDFGAKFLKRKGSVDPDLDLEF